MTRQEVAKLVTVMVAATGQASKLDKKAVDDTVAAYEALLGDLDYARCNAAVRVLLQTSKWLPAVADIRKAVLELEHGPVRSGAQAWGDLRKLERMHEADELHFYDPVVIKICQDYGWIQWRTLWRNGEDVEQWHVVRGENEAADRARFIEAYDDLAGQGRREQQAPLLAAARELRARGQLSSAGDLVAGLLQQHAKKELPDGKA